MANSCRVESRPGAVKDNRKTEPVEDTTGQRGLERERNESQQAGAGSSAVPFRKFGYSMKGERR